MQFYLDRIINSFRIGFNTYTITFKFETQRNLHIKILTHSQLMGTHKKIFQYRFCGPYQLSISCSHVHTSNNGMISNIINQGNNISQWISPMSSDTAQMIVFPHFLLYYQCNTEYYQNRSRCTVIQAEHQKCPSSSIL